MPHWQRIYIAACVAVIGFCVSYVLCDFGAWPRLTYFPYERSWRLTTQPGGAIAMAYVGTILWGLGGAMLGGASSYALTRLARQPMSDRWLRLLGAWALAGFAYAGLYYTWSLWPF
ncbi:MAG: hypothetical protein MJE77_29755 [Proteobacteria bacterium]|nr:hypothetical protein [Pseudomonadota bacterium]